MTDATSQAFKAVDRINFVPEDLKSRAHFDAPLPIGYGQTISQLTTVKMMLQWLEPKTGQRILDVGSGSGWTTALLAYLVGQTGWVDAVELVPELVEFGRSNAEKAGVQNVQFHLAGKQLGLPKQAPYDRILVSAAAEKFPEELLKQLKPGGKLVIPVKNDICEVKKKKDGSIETINHPGFVFVPLIN